MNVVGRNAPQCACLKDASGCLFFIASGTRPEKPGRIGRIPSSRMRCRIFCCSTRWLSIQPCGSGPSHCLMFPILFQGRSEGPAKKCSTSASLRPTAGEVYRDLNMCSCPTKASGVLILLSAIQSISASQRAQSQAHVLYPKAQTLK